MMVAHEQRIDEVAQEELGLTFKSDQGYRDRNKVGMLQAL